MEGMFPPPRLSQCHVSFRLPKIEEKSLLQSLTEPDREFVVDGEVLQVVILLRPKGITMERLRELVSLLELSYSFEVGGAEEKATEHTEDRIPTTKGVYVFPFHHFSWSCPSLMDLSWQQIETDSNHFALIAEYPIPVSLPRTAVGKEVILQVNIRESWSIPTDDVVDAVQMIYQREKSTPLLNVTTKKKLQVIQGFQSRYWFTRNPSGSFLCFSVENMMEELCLRLGFPMLDLYSAHSVVAASSPVSGSNQHNRSAANTVSSTIHNKNIDSNISSYVSVRIPHSCSKEKKKEENAAFAKEAQGMDIFLRPKEEYCFVFHFTWKTDTYPCEDFMDPLIETPLRFFWQLHGSSLPSMFSEFPSECVYSVRWKLPSRLSAVSISFSGPETVLVDQVFSLDITVVNKSQEDIQQGLLLLHEKYLDQGKQSATDNNTTWQTTQDYALEYDSTPLHVQFPKSILSLGRIPQQESVTVRTDVTVTKQGLIRLPHVHLLDKTNGTHWKFEYAFEVFASIAQME
ncbi:hypothetical protein GAYE_SCF28MG4783 [Galdieria yellowstonensis]|uniref:Uncharacterized protein n=1 Tax=Galdieria yellowstonensis TaxID=3028027 RepID=A0AAV9IHM7_9RHOD|nr:hypothetical protein GAYE_SCF28MG4783 [Galdieria yellowstonensis]